MKDKSRQEEPSEAFASEVKAARGRFIEAMDDDINTSAGLAAVFDFVRATYQRDSQSTLSGGEARGAHEFIQEVDGVLNILRAQPELLDEEIAAQIEARQAARKRRDFTEADRIRDWLAAKGIQLADTRKGVRWKRI
jgi:cysteinyl-tRNA synthetase